MGRTLFRRATPLFRRAPRRPWPPERPSHPPEATGGLPVASRGSERLRKILTMPPHGRRASSTVPPPCPALAGTVASGQSLIPLGKAPKPSCTPPPMAGQEAYFVGHRPYSVVHPHRAQPLREWSQAGKALFRRATSLLRRPPRRPWRSERPSHPPEATGGLPAARWGHRLALFHRATPLFRRAPCHPWPPERPSHPPEASQFHHATYAPIPSCTPTE